MEQTLEELKKENRRLKELLDTTLDNNERLDYHCSQLWQVISIVTDILDGSHGWYDLLELEQKRIEELKSRIGYRRSRKL